MVAPYLAAGGRWNPATRCSCSTRPLRPLVRPGTPLAHAASPRVVVSAYICGHLTFFMRFLRRFGRPLLVSGSLLTGCQPDPPTTTQPPAAK
jgi:hypothetical protein